MTAKLPVDVANATEESSKEVVKTVDALFEVAPCCCDAAELPCCGCVARKCTSGSTTGGPLPAPAPLPPPPPPPPAPVHEFFAGDVMENCGHCRGEKLNSPVSSSCFHSSNFALGKFKKWENHFC